MEFRKISLPGLAGYIVAYQRWQKETSAQLKTTLRKSRKKHTHKPVSAPKKEAFGGVSFDLRIISL